MCTVTFGNHVTIYPSVLRHYYITKPGVKRCLQLLWTPTTEISLEKDVIRGIVRTLSEVLSIFICIHSGTKMINYHGKGKRTSGELQSPGILENHVAWSWMMIYRKTEQSLKSSWNQWIYLEGDRIADDIFSAKFDSKLPKLFQRLFLRKKQL